MKKVYCGLLTVLVLAGISLGFYFHNRALVADQSACQTMAQKAVGDYQDGKTESGFPTPNDMLSSRASYNRALKGCFIELRDSFGNSDVSVTSTVIMGTPSEDNLGGCIDAIQGIGQAATVNCHDADDKPISQEAFRALEAKYMGSGHI